MHMNTFGKKETNKIFIMKSALVESVRFYEITFCAGKMMLSNFFQIDFVLQ